ncbi:hypothetical protein KDM87_14060 [Undibacterium sp. FT147W]|uniref:Uncharacterized protein n=1 Tax=Undibacterium rivi TaxID=2828729 RepID=A0ABS5H6F7_9BURK|nr:hypothetical protein [Undibacterium rivi]MBR7793719.1 hypothetical protein [Undibacterium rivi]
MLPIQVDQLLSNKRFRKTKRRRDRIQIKKRKQSIKTLEHKQRFGERSHIIRMLARSFKKDVKETGKVLIVDVPKVFSIIENPISSIGLIQKFAKVVREHRVKSIRIDQTKLEVYDLAANALLDLVASEIVVEGRQKRIKTKFSGLYPKEESVKRFIRSMGIVKHLNVKHELPNRDETAELRLFDKRNRHYTAKSDPRKADFKSKTIQEFSDHIDTCLGDHNRKLTARARFHLCEYIGEILCNAEDHPGFVDWTIQGYLDNSLDDPICEIAIFNFGKSIGETLKALPKDSYTRQQIDPYLKLQHGAGFFSNVWRQTDLLTLMALQGHVSSKNTSKNDTRGQGTGDLIGFFQKVYKECAATSKIKAKMAIVSGGTYFLFDGKYEMRESAGRGKVIAFNAANDLYQKPDSEYVKPLADLHFPGTIISIRFPLSSKSTITLAEN